MNPIKALKEMLFSKHSAPQSRLEYLFATQEGAKHLDHILILREDNEMRIPMAIANGVLIFSGVKAKRLQDGMHDTIREFNKHRIPLSRVPDAVHCSFDELFVEVSALYFFAALREYWSKEDEENDEETDYYDESGDAPYFDVLKQSLYIADRFINEFSGEIGRAHV